MSLTDTEPGIAIAADGQVRQNRPTDWPLYRKGLAQLYPTLRKLGFESLRPGQDRAVMNLLMGKDTLSFLPTSAGKTLIYILPALCLNYKCLIFSPLVSLMKDQVESLWRMNLSAACISGGQTKTENDMALRAWECGDLQFLLVAPERMSSEDFMQAMTRQRPNIVTVDESHCLSQWGDSFRPAYLQIGPFIDMCNPDLVLALTATATAAIEVDIRRTLRIPLAHKIVYYPARENLILGSQPLMSDWDIFRYLKTVSGPSIVYCPTQRKCEELYFAFGDQVKDGALVYHGGLDDGVRTANQESFMSNQVRVMFATNAFGLGINKPDIRSILHCGFSKSVEAYCQESGRAGRDGKDSACVLFYNQDSYATQTFLIDLNYPNRRLIERVVDYLVEKMDRASMVNLTGAQIADAINERERAGQVSSALRILARYGVVERSKETEPLARVRILADTPDPVMQSCLDLIKSVGVKASDGYYEFSMPMFVATTKWKDKQVRATLATLDRNGFVQFTKPFRGKTTKVLKDLKEVNFDELQIRRQDEIKRLAALKDYVNVPDTEKHQFLLDYFGIK